MTTKTVTCQKEWEAIPKRFEGVVIIDTAEPIRLEPSALKSRTTKVCGRSKVYARGAIRLEVCDGAQVFARDHVVVEARDNASVHAYNHAHVNASGSTRVFVQDAAYIEASGNARVYAEDCAHVVARDKVHVHASGASNVVAMGQATVVANARSIITLLEKTFGVANDHVSAHLSGESRALATGHSVITCTGRSCVHASQYAHIYAHEHARVVAEQCCRVVRCSKWAAIRARGLAVVVSQPVAVREFCKENCVEIRGKSAILYTPGNELKAFADHIDIGKQTDLPEEIWVGTKAAAISREVSGPVRDTLRIYEVAVPLSAIYIDSLRCASWTTRLTVLREVPYKQWGAWRAYAKVMARDREACASA